MVSVNVTIYTDPGCPFGFVAQPQHAQLLWHYGDRIDVTLRMIVLLERRASFEERGLRREMVARNMASLVEQSGMPMSTEPPHYKPATIDACRVYVGARMHEPERALGLLRALRCRAFSVGEPLDEVETIHAAADEAGVSIGAVDAWLADDAVAAALETDMAAARAPVAEALALKHKFSRGHRVPRYPTGSALFERDDRMIAAPGLQSFAVYEVAMANLAPEVERRPVAREVSELLKWAPYPLATAEVAELRGVSFDAARRELKDAGAAFTARMNDGYWAAA